MKPNTEWNLPGGELTSLHSEIKRIYCKPNCGDISMVWRVSCVCVISFIQIINMKKKKPLPEERNSPYGTTWPSVSASHFSFDVESVKNTVPVSEHAVLSFWKLRFPSFTGCISYLEGNPLFLLPHLTLFCQTGCVSVSGTMSRSLTIM